MTTACATSRKTADADPVEPTNRVFFDINETLDGHIIKPVARKYVDITPEPVRQGVTNFFNNLTYLNVIFNDVLQGKFEQGVNDSLRLVFNSTLGIGGLFDVATPMGLNRNQEDFGQTLAVWGVDRSAYLYLPLLGPNTVRNSTDYVPSTLLNPLYYVSGGVLFPVNIFAAINRRANLLKATDIRDEAAIDTYVFTREAYLQKRESLIYDGNPPLDNYDDLFQDEEDSDSDIPPR